MTLQRLLSFRLLSVLYDEKRYKVSEIWQTDRPALQVFAGRKEIDSLFEIGLEQRTVELRSQELLCPGTGGESRFDPVGRPLNTGHDESSGWIGNKRTVLGKSVRRPTCWAHAGDILRVRRKDLQPHDHTPLLSFPLIFLPLHPQPFP